MASILKTCKYINLFTGYHLKTYQSNYSPLQHVLKSHCAALHVKRNYASVAVLEFQNAEPLPPPTKILKFITDRYINSNISLYRELVMLLQTVNENSSLIKPAFIDLALEKNMQILIHCCGKAMKNEMPNVRAQIINHLWQTYKTMGLHLNVSHYNALLRVHLENEQDFSPAEILLEMSVNDIQPNDVTYEYLLTHYCRKGNIQEANKILEHLKENEIPVNENIFSALIIGNAEANDMNGALKIFGIMKIMGCIPSSQTYAALLEAYAKKGDMENIMDTLRNCESKNIIILDKHKMDVIYYLAVNGHAKHIDQILSTFSWDNSFALESKNFISKLMYRKQIDVAIQVLLAAKKAGVPEYRLTHCEESFSRHIVALKLPVEKVIEVLNLLEKKGFVMYENALHHCLYDKILQYCIPLLRAWSRAGFEIKEHFFWPIFAMHGTQNSKGVLETLKLMKCEFGIIPSFDTLIHFVLRYIGNSNSGDIMKILIHDFEIPADYVVNSILYHHLSKNRLETAVKCIKESSDYSINYNKEMLVPLLENALKITNNTAAYNIIKSRFQFRKGFGENRVKSKLFLPPTLYNIDLGYKLQHYSEKGDLNGAEECMNKLKRRRLCKLMIHKLLSYFDLLVKHDKVADALKILQDFSSEEMCIVWFSKKTLDQYVTSLNLLADKGSVEGVNKLFNFLKKKKMNIDLKVTEPLVKVHLVRNNPKEALEVVKRIHKEHKHIPGRIKLMKAFIEAEEVESLQWLTDFSMQHFEERITLLPLAVAFLKCQRLRQCRRILESASLPLKDYLLRNCVNTLFAEEDISAVQDLIQVTKGLVSINRNVLYDMLLEKYSELNNWEKGLALWKQMQEENFVPSEPFLIILAELLKRNGQSIPDSVTQSFTVENQDEFYAKVTEMYIKNKSYPCREFLNVLLENLVNAGDIKSIELIENHWQSIYSQYLKNKPILFEAYVKANKVDSYLQQIMSASKAGNDSKVENFVLCLDYKWITHLLTHPSDIESFETLAEQIYSQQHFFKPMLLVLSYYLLKDSPRAVEMWNKYITNMRLTTNAYSFLVQAYMTADCFDQLPQLAERIHECRLLNIRMFYEAFLDAYEERNKYEVGLQVLSRFKPTKLEKKVEDEEENELKKSQVAL